MYVLTVWQGKQDWRNKNIHDHLAFVHTVSVALEENERLNLMNNEVDPSVPEDGMDLEVAHERDPDPGVVRAPIDAGHEAMKPVFQRYLRPEKDYLSFSLIYDNGKRSLDLICKDKVDGEVWFVGLKALISSSQCGRSKIDGWSDGGLCFDDTKDLITKSASDSSISTILDGSPDNNLNLIALPLIYSSENLENSEKSDVINMQGKGVSSDIFRVSVSSAPSTSSHGSAHDDCDVVGDIYVWGEVICDNSTRASTDSNTSPIIARNDILLPKPLESNLVLDVHHVACGVRHAALVTRQGEVFTWGEESEFHTCAVTTAGELYTWGDGTHNVGLLGHGTDVSHWIPKRVSGPLDGLQVAFVTCGHGNRESVSHPKEVESLMGLKTIAVACGVWHTAAVVEVIATQSSASVSSGKLFTWGDGDKYRLGHGDKEPRLKPTCVPSLIDYNFHKLACGHSVTIGLTTSGHVFTMGSTVYGQLGNPQSDGKLPCLVEDKLASESVTEVACGSYHVTILTTRNEVYTWGKGANGRLGHGDLEDKKTPTLVEALKDRTVKRVACGSNFTAAICSHKWVSGAEQSQCSACRQAFGFTRKRHNCYNCGLVHCHSCSSRKAMRAALAPNPGKPYRVCDSCYLKLSKVLESGGINNRRNVIPRLSGESKDRFDKVDKLSKASLPSNLDLIKNLDIKAAKHGKKTESLALIRASQVPSMLQFKDISFSGGFDLNRAIPRPIHTSVPQSVNHSRAVSPFSRKPSPPRSATPVPTTSGLSFSKSVADSLKKTNELLSLEVQKLRAQVDSLRQRCELQEFELQKSAKKAQEAMGLAAEESAKSKAAKEVIKSLTAQLKDMAERLPPGVYENDQITPVYMPNGVESHTLCPSDLRRENQLRNDSNSGAGISSSINSVLTNGLSAQNHLPRNSHEASELSTRFQNNWSVQSNQSNESLYSAARDSNAERHIASTRAEDHNCKETEPRVNGVERCEIKSLCFTCRRRFGEHQAETWWSENRDKVYEKYNVRGSDRPSSAPSMQSARRSDGEFT
ncbi:hypothetical protein J5N97_012073 [Dioscorea zingiberensis]|uniref:FYVE-type domain-containing protein n=1 Tax=Dioscorea zingiberensis TaxID=325984 RepID=A0A9D5CPI2_9LILI|nr:hypothetical protein J5N97_012073 [Dioscorea zingiberensis]